MESQVTWWFISPEILLNSRKRILSSEEVLPPTMKPVGISLCSPNRITRGLHWMRHHCNRVGDRFNEFLIWIWQQLGIIKYKPSAAASLVFNFFLFFGMPLLMFVVTTKIIPLEAIRAVVMHRMGVRVKLLRLLPTTDRPLKNRGVLWKVVVLTI